KTQIRRQMAAEVGGAEKPVLHSMMGDASQDHKIKTRSKDKTKSKPVTKIGQTEPYLEWQSSVPVQPARQQHGYISIHAWITMKQYRTRIPASPMQLAAATERQSLQRRGGVQQVTYTEGVVPRRR
ncbi:hypothetical protein Vretifemale_7345, partial [Volvox reticuliferus]